MRPDQDDFVIAARLTTSPGNVTWFKPMLLAPQVGSSLITASRRMAAVAAPGRSVELL
jgi:hypothetical protein